MVLFRDMPLGMREVWSFVEIGGMENLATRVHCNGGRAAMISEKKGLKICPRAPTCLLIRILFVET